MRGQIQVDEEGLVMVALAVYPQGGLWGGTFLGYHDGQPLSARDDVPNADEWIVWTASEEAAWEAGLDRAVSWGSIVVVDDKHARALTARYRWCQRQHARWLRRMRRQEQGARPVKRVAGRRTARGRR